MPVKALVLDVETTGLTLPSVADLSKQPRIIEIGCVLVKGGKVVDTLGMLISPGEEVSKEITKITGITNEDLLNKPTFSAMLPMIQQFFRSADMIIAHNAPFDCSCIKHELSRLNWKEFPWPNTTICTVQEYEHLFGRRVKLTELYKHILGKELKQTHRALDDALALSEIVIAEGIA